MLSAIFPTFKHMENTLPASAAITTQDLIGFILYTVIYVPVIWFIRPRIIRLALYPSFFLTMAVFLGLLIWAVKINGGIGPSSVLGPAFQLTSSQRAFRFIQCASSVSGTWGSCADRYSDWSRFEKKKFRSLPGLIVLPLIVTLCGAFGVLTTTATANHFGVVQWNPILLLEYVQTLSYTPGCRAATFFAGLAFYYCQIFINLSQNTIPFGMDVAAAFPRYFNIRRATLMCVVIYLIIQPWRFLSQAVIFLTILSSVTSKYLLRLTSSEDLAY
jgi:NCS1 family nucleobase:cation symporter-1